MKDVVYSDLPKGAEDVIFDIINNPNCRGEEIERVIRADAQTIEIVWYDDIGDVEDEPLSKVHTSVINAVRNTLQNIFGNHWRVSRKADERRWNDDHPQRAIVRRADRQRFTYESEPKHVYLINLHGRPDNAPSDAIWYGDLDVFPTPPTVISSEKYFDIYIYDSGSGTKHILPGTEPGRHFRESCIAEPVSARCGLTVQPEDAIEEVEHFGSVINEMHPRDLPTNPHPKDVFEEDLCQRCWASYSSTKKVGYGSNERTENRAPGKTFGKILQWDYKQDNE